MEPDSGTPGASLPASEVAFPKCFRRTEVMESLSVQGAGWLSSPLWSPRSKVRKAKLDGEMSSDGAWLDDHSDFTSAYFSRRASVISDPQADMTPRFLKSMGNLDIISHKDRCDCQVSHDLHDPLMMAPHRGMSVPVTPILSAPDKTDCSLWPSVSPCPPICLCSNKLPFAPYAQPSVGPNSVSCGLGEGCPWMIGLLGGGLRWMGSVAELCQEALNHAGELLAAEGGALSLVRKVYGGESDLEEVISLTVNGCSQAHQNILQGVMELVLATGSPINLRDAQKDPKFKVDSKQCLKIRTVLSVPIKNHRREMLGVVVMINKRKGCDSHPAFTSMDEKVISNHMDVLGMVLENIQLYESSRQEAKRSQALIEMAQVLSREHHSFEVLLSKMAATIMPFTHAQYCTIFIPSDQTSVTKDDEIIFSCVIHLECEELGSTCQIYRREHDISDIDLSHACETMRATETVNMAKSAVESERSIVCCPVRNERSENVIAVCQLINKRTRDSDELEPFNRYDERLLEDLAVYCGLALQYAQAVKITEVRRASIEVTEEILAYHLTAAEEDIKALQETTIPSAESLNILDFHFSDFGLPEDATTQATVRMFLDLNLVQDFNIDYKSLCQWVLTVRRGYRSHLPYHNWSHALSTAQSMFAMLMATDQLQKNLSRLEILALMIATLNHDIDHRGVSNSYIERSQQPLAQLYGHSSLENHHYNLCIFIMNNTGSQILSNLSDEDHRSVLHMIKRAVLATNLNIYMQRRGEFFSLAEKSRVNWRSEKQRDLLRSMLMTASDLSAITKPWPEQKRIANLVAMEFFAQGDKEREEFKTKPIDVMDRENSTRLPYMQVEYIDEICFPLYKAVSKLFDSCSPLVNACKKNRKNWLHLAEGTREEKLEDNCSLYFETEILEEEEAERGAEQLAKEQNT
ncbi:cGMP-specific 3',5'-cyclic phosphodiesterase-like [Xiphophorus maculatus]|uniref:cGMP-specific 3',5'-cyclic phosphodiesterase-like n=1 Tax=Xiphophorus maculatus TaxID=8083 RepID=UPI000C6E8B2C|nr:cGMP-specific 3',5'-cyclic phosphodiesterase-like [Xiphophorus maculatus]